MSSSVFCSQLSDGSTISQYREYHTLNHSIDNPLLFWPSSPSSQITRYRLVDLDKSMLLVRHMEFMLVGQLVIPSTKLSNGLVMMVQECCVSMTVSIASVMIAFKAEQDILAVPAASLEIGRPDAEVAIPRLDQIAVVAEDIRCRLTRGMLLRRSVRDPSEGGQEQVTTFDLIRSRNGDIQPWWCQIWS